MKYYSTQEWKDLRKAAFERDGYVCQRCGFVGRSGVISFSQKLRGMRSLVAHHVTARKGGGDDNVGNLRTLCAPCHVQVERVED